MSGSRLSVTQLRCSNCKRLFTPQPRGEEIPIVCPPCELWFAFQEEEETA